MKKALLVLATLALGFEIGVGGKRRTGRTTLAPKSKKIDAPSGDEIARLQALEGLSLVVRGPSCELVMEDLRAGKPVKVPLVDLAPEACVAGGWQADSAKCYEWTAKRLAKELGLSTCFARSIDCWGFDVDMAKYSAAVDTVMARMEEVVVYLKLDAARPIRPGADADVEEGMQYRTHTDIVMSPERATSFGVYILPGLRGWLTSCLVVSMFAQRCAADAATGRA